MTATDDFVIEPGLIPKDIPPPTEDHAGVATPFDPEYPDSTADAPYGFLPNGSPRKRRPKGGSSKGTSRGGMPAGKQAENAAALLASLNGLIGMALMAAGMPKSAVTLAENNDKFQSMAQQALSADPALCKKILSTGATGGKTGLIVAYGMLIANMYPAMKTEYRENHPKEIDPNGD